MLHLRLAIDNIFSQFKRFLISVIIIAVSIITLVCTVLAYELQGYAYDSCDELLAQGFEKTGVLYVDDETEHEIEDAGTCFWEDASTRKEIASLGCMSTYLFRFSDELLNIQGENDEEIFITNGDEFTVMTIDARSLNLCNMELSKGIEPEELEFSRESGENIHRYIYLGSAYESIPIGTEYIMEGAGYSFVYTVAGILEEGQRWVSPNLSIEMNSTSIDYTIDCTYGIFCVDNLQYFTNELWISASDEYSIDEAVEVCLEVADKYGVTVRYTTLTELYETSCMENVQILSYLAEVFVIIVPAVLLMLIAMQIVSMLFELNTYGIMCSMGFGTKDISIMIMIKNIIMALMGLVIAAPVIVWIEKSFMKEAPAPILAEVPCLVALPIAVVILLVVIFLTTIVSIIMLKRYTPVELMGKRN